MKSGCPKRMSKEVSLIQKRWSASSASMSKAVGSGMTNYIALIYRSWPGRRTAAPIADSGGEIIEQAKEEMFFAWGL